MYENGPGLEGQDIICLGTVEWLVVHSVAEYTMQGFARSNRVLFVEPFGSWITLRRMARWQKRKREKKPRLEQVDENLWIYRPPPIGLPGISRWRWASRVNDRILDRLLRGVVKELGFRRPLLWSYLYNTATVLRHFPSRLSIYECGDHDAALARDEAQRRMVRAHEADTCRAADLVFAVTDELAEPRRAHNPKTHAVYCGAAMEFFGRALLPETVVPDDIARLPKPVLGYLGGVDPWKMNVDLLKQIARRFPERSIALVGYVWFGFDAATFADTPNIHVLGPKDYEDFPGYLKGMDACIMPFPLNDITRNGDALKLYEYLAGGRAVVSADVPAARRFPGIVRIAETADDFAVAVDEALAEPLSRAAERVEAVRPHSWDERNRQKAALIREALAQKEGTG
ncbi:glycosyltransferase [Roseomonas sp. OT10]|uniref:glycosyltransferase n=1 Tax=Roseomonas cutis TaxID=2897332 RepID=UPI001E28B88F|nr:glycosyltransferase [Roseomonas sp. OT10]UFN47518.1 glycosyltransferase [Roseomonas sp. OT10]